MFGKKIFRPLFFTSIVLSILWVATPKVYLQSMMSPLGSILKVDAETKIEATPSQDADYEKYDKPAYFNIFKFICSFIPSRQRHEGKLGGSLHGISIF